MPLRDRGTEYECIYNHLDLPYQTMVDKYVQPLFAGLRHLIIYALIFLVFSNDLLIQTNRRSGRKRQKIEDKR